MPTSLSAAKDAPHRRKSGDAAARQAALAKIGIEEARRRALQNAPLFKTMRPDELEAILRLASDRRWPRGTVIFQKGDPGSSMMAIVSGRVRVSSISPEGREITLCVIGAGEVFGEIALLDGKPRSADVTAIDDVHALVIEQRHFIPFLKSNDDLYIRMLSVLCERLRRTSMALEELALFDQPARLARVLLKLAEDYGRVVAGGTRIDVKMSQRDLSTLVVSSRESVNKQLRSWREDGVVSIDGGYIILCRPDDLRALVA